MKVFVTGATGYVGARVVERLLERGQTVTGLARSEAGAARLTAAGATALRGDLAQTDLVAAAANDADATIHLGFTHDGDFDAAVRVDHDVHAALVTALKGTGKALIVSNGTGVLGDTGDRIADETTPIDLNFPLAARCRAENLVTGARDLCGMVVRLPLLVYGHGASVFLPMLLASARATGVSAYIGNGENRMSMVHVDDVADLYVLALERGAASQVYFASAGSDVSLAEVAHAVAENVGPDCRVMSCSPEAAADLWNPVWAWLLSLTNRVSGDKARRELGWSPRSDPGLLWDVANGSYVSGKGHREAST